MICRIILSKISVILIYKQIVLSYFCQGSKLHLHFIVNMHIAVKSFAWLKSPEIFIWLLNLLGIHTWQRLTKYWIRQSSSIQNNLFLFQLKTFDAIIEIENRLSHTQAFYINKIRCVKISTITKHATKGWYETHWHLRYHVNISKS